jgi:opacity protein-like surface antigen
VKKQVITSASLILAALLAAVPVHANDRTGSADPSGFYGGISLRDRGLEGEGLTFGHLTSVWSKFTLPTADDAGTRALAYGGYRWTNDLSVEAALATNDRYTLRPPPPGGRSGVGLALTGDSDITSRTWSVDVYTAWGFLRSFSLYGRMGYAQTDTAPAIPPAFGTDVRRNRDGVNYGVGLRYDMSSALGLRLEYARFGRLPGDTFTGLLPDNDQVQFGVQFRF